MSIKINTFRAHTSCINRIKQSPFNGFVATTSVDKTVKIWNITKNNGNWFLIQTYTGHTNGVCGIEFISENMIATGSMDSTIQMWSLYTGLTTKTINTSANVYALQLLSNGFDLAAGLDMNINIYNINTLNLISTLIGHTNCVVDLVLINKDLLASSGVDWRVRIWNLTKNSMKFTPFIHNWNVYGLKLVSSEILASGSYDNTTKLWNITTGSLIRTLTGHTDKINWAVDMLNDGSTLVTGSVDHTLKFWNIDTGDCSHTVNTGMSIRSMAVLNETISASSK